MLYLHEMQEGDVDGLAMTEEATLIKSFDYAVKVSQGLQETMKGCAGSVDYLCSQLRRAINIIEFLSEQLDRVMRERDAAVEEWKSSVMACKAMCDTCEFSDNK